MGRWKAVRPSVRLAASSPPGTGSSCRETPAGSAQQDQGNALHPAAPGPRQNHSQARDKSSPFINVIVFLLLFLSFLVLIFL